MTPNTSSSVPASASSAGVASSPSVALVLMGGGARTAYQVGVLRAVGAILQQHGHDAARFPFQILIGTSAGAINIACLGSYACQGLGAFEELYRIWCGMRSHHVYQLGRSPWVKSSLFFAAVSLSRNARAHGALLNNMPLIDTLHHTISLPDIERALERQVLDAIAVTASSYTSGTHWTFCQTLTRQQGFKPWSRLGRRAEFQPLSIEHLAASSAIPFIFPATPLWVDGQREYFGDGSMRHVMPLAPALHLGAQRIMAIGVAQPQRAGFFKSTDAGESAPTGPPSLGTIAGHALASVFQDSLQADVEQLLRINGVVDQMPSHLLEVLPFRKVQALVMQPSQSLDALAQEYSHELPTATRNTLQGVGALKGSGAALASYLMFEPGFVQALIALGEYDAQQRMAELLEFFGGSPATG